MMDPDDILVGPPPHFFKNLVEEGTDHPRGFTSDESEGFSEGEDGMLLTGPGKIPFLFIYSQCNVHAFKCDNISLLFDHQASKIASKTAVAIVRLVM